MRMNLNQQSHGSTWETHKNLMNSMSPIVDCGVHYVDVMCLMTQSKPTSVSAIGARLSSELKDGMYNYGQLQVRFEDQSVGWYEAGWGPMISETAYFVKDVMGPGGSVSIVDKNPNQDQVSSDNVDGHSATNALLLHHSKTAEDGSFLEKDQLLDTTNEPDHQGLCDLEQQFFLNAIQQDQDLIPHLDDAINSLRVVLAADESFKTGENGLFVDNQDINQPCDDGIPWLQFSIRFRISADLGNLYKCVFPDEIVPPLPQQNHLLRQWKEFHTHKSEW